MKAIIALSCCAALVFQMVVCKNDNNFKSSSCKKNAGSEAYCKSAKEQGLHNNPGGYILAQENTVGFCFSKKNECNRNLKQQETWIIHGLWPTKDSGGLTGLCNCDEDSYFNASNIKNIEGIDKYWPDLLSENQYWLWCHEWYTHGSCVYGRNNNTSQYNYFTTVIELYKVYNFTKILEKSNILPTNSRRYRLDDFLNAFQDDSEVGVKPTITCRKNGQQQQYIFQIKLCLDSAPYYSPVDCKDTQGCEGDEQIYYKPA